MKNRLNLTIDPQVVHRARRVARRENMSLSALVERLLGKVIKEGLEAEPADSFSQRWSGKLKLAQRNTRRSERLARKYRDR